MGMKLRVVIRGLANYKLRFEIYDWKGVCEPFMREWWRGQLRGKFAASVYWEVQAVGHKTRAVSA